MFIHIYKVSKFPFLLLNYDNKLTILRKGLNIQINIRRWKMKRYVVSAVLLFSIAWLSNADVKKEYLCGIAIGFQPYQYVNEKGEPAGIDYDVTKAVFDNAGLKVTFIQEPWDNVLLHLMHNVGKVSMVCGAEMSDERKKYLDFTDSYYSRNIVIFTLKDSAVEKISDLYGQIITGDRHSFIERFLGDSKNKIRIMTTVSKEDSFIKLKDKKVVAVVAPLEVGNFIAKKMGLEVRVLSEKDPGSHVAFAVAKGDKELLDILNNSLSKLIKDGTVIKIMNKYK